MFRANAHLSLKTQVVYIAWKSIVLQHALQRWTHQLFDVVTVQIIFCILRVLVIHPIRMIALLYRKNLPDCSNTLTTPQKT